MEIILLKDISYNPDPVTLARELHLRPGSRSMEEFSRSLEEALEVIQPKVVYGVAGVEKKDRHTVLIDGQTFTSRVMSVNLEGLHRVFPYVATCGREIYDWKLSLDDTLGKYYADIISGDALRTAHVYLVNHLQTVFQLGESAAMNPGSLEDWPIEAQTDLFALFGDVDELVGVKLLDSLLMAPSQTVSGIRFETESGYVNCALCPREKCNNRRAPYQPDLLARKYS